MILLQNMSLRYNLVCSYNNRTTIYAYVIYILLHKFENTTRYLCLTTSVMCKFWSDIVPYVRFTGFHFAKPTATDHRERS